MTLDETLADTREMSRVVSAKAGTVPTMAQTSVDDDAERDVVVGVTDSRVVAVYLTAPGSDDYVAIMDVLEASVTDMTPAEVGQALASAGHPLDARLVVARLDRLRQWSAVFARTDNSRILRYSDIVARNWRYTPTPVGRQVQRFYRSYLVGLPVVREIPLTNLERLVAALEQLAGLADRATSVTTADLVTQVFTAHDDLDGALVGAEDALAGFADRFDLDDGKAAELKALLVDYATHVAVELSRGSARADRALALLVASFPVLAAEAVEGSTARELIARGALVASKGGRVEDWLGLSAWCDPERGRAQRFALRLVRALPSMHANLRRLHTSSGTATSRARAIALATACYSSDLAPALFLAALGDHPWRKLHGRAEDDELARVPSWRAGPTVAVADLLRLTGRSGARGRPPAPRDDTAARAEVEARRKVRQIEHDAALREVLGAAAGAALGDAAARLAMAALMAAARATTTGPRRTATRHGLACTLFVTPQVTSVLRAPTWRVFLPGRTPVFHAHGTTATAPAVALADDADTRALIVVDGAA